ncbi:NUDIX hydrolase [Kitasatospora brasiliensis]|uniref:NUDIX hydrolase n=1 Tax=Kitasatospora brasiliensis TaxID=3058040 RepID=UPI00292E7D06|nr:NUDIX hydrolase [Kitasatospora sp. K002]
MTEQLPAVAVAIVVKDGRVLMVRRRIAEGELSWQFPAGEVEARESPEAAAVRETAEETGLHVAAAKVLGERVHPQNGRRMFYTACEVVGGAATVVDSDELDRVVWASRAELAEYVPFPMFPPVRQHLDGLLTG